MVEMTICGMPIVVDDRVPKGVLCMMMSERSIAQARRVVALLDGGRVVALVRQDDDSWVVDRPSDKLED